MRAMITTGAFVAVICVMAVWLYSRRSATRGKPIVGDQDHSPSAARVYLDLRATALATTPESVQLLRDSPDPFGVLMEMGLPSGVVMVTSFASGDASIYFGMGGGMLGGIGHATTSAAAKQWVSAAAAYLTTLSLATDYPLPAAGRIRFYVLTRKGVLTGEGDGDAIRIGTDPLNRLFAAADNVITQFRLLDQSGQPHEPGN